MSGQRTNIKNIYYRSWLLQKKPIATISEIHVSYNNIRMIIEESSNRVLRGGSWNNAATNCRVANRNNNSPENRNNNNGFRVLLSQLKRRADTHC